MDRTAFFGLVAFGGIVASFQVGNVLPFVATMLVIGVVESLICMVLNGK
jgi:hypothetical protein